MASFIPHPTELVLIGCGSMGGALLKGWLKQDLFQSVIISTIEEDILDSFSSHTATLSRHEPGTPLIPCAPNMKRVFCLAVKPHMMAAVLKNLAPFIQREELVMSVAAGLELSFYAEHLGEKQPFVRVMPNTPTAIGQGFSGLLANTICTTDHKNMAEIILEAVGRTLWVDSDDKIDRLTTISGCGPAYIFALVEAFQVSAKSMGFNEEDANRLARATVEGSAAYLKQATDLTATELKNNVASPGGMTAEGLRVLQETSAFDDLITKAVHATYDKAQALKRG